MYFPKGTILALYFQVFPRTMPVLRTTLYFVTGCTVLCCCATFGLDTFYCHNIIDNWYVNMTLSTDICFMCRSALCFSLMYARHQHVHRLFQMSFGNIISTASQQSVINTTGVWLTIISLYRSLEEGACSTFESLSVFQADWAMEFTTDIFSELSLSAPIRLFYNCCTVIEIQPCSLRSPFSAPSTSTTQTSTILRSSPNLRPRSHHHSR
jgi:hypothetical protein